MEYLVTMTTHVPDGTPAEDVAEATAGETVRTGELARQGHLVRLWLLPAEHGVSRALGLFRAAGDAQMQAMLGSLPLYPYFTAETTKLTPHPSDPAALRSREPIGADHG